MDAWQYLSAADCGRPACIQRGQCTCPIRQFRLPRILVCMQGILLSLPMMYCPSMVMAHLHHAYNTTGKSRSFCLVSTFHRAAYTHVMHITCNMHSTWLPLPGTCPHTVEKRMANSHLPSPAYAH